MKNLLKPVISILFLLLTSSAFASDAKELISPYQNSQEMFSDNIGYETHYYLFDETNVRAIEGEINRKFYTAPKGVTPLEIIKNYEQALKTKGAEIIHLSQNAYRHTNQESGERILFMRDLFSHARIKHQGYAHLMLPRKANHYLSAKVSRDASDIFISVASAVVDDVNYYEVVTVVAKAMDMNNVTLNILNDGIANNGKVPIYDIYFDTGKFTLKENSDTALTTIASYLQKNKQQQFVVVGHTDNTGDFNANLKLSLKRAQAVVDALVQNYAIEKKQIMAYGVGSVAPVTSNSSEDGKGRNRRVELVEK